MKAIDRSNLTQLIAESTPGWNTSEDFDDVRGVFDEYYALGRDLTPEEREAGVRHLQKSLDAVNIAAVGMAADHVRAIESYLDEHFVRRDFIS